MAETGRPINGDTVGHTWGTGRGYRIGTDEGIRTPDFNNGTIQRQNIPRPVAYPLQDVNIDYARHEAVEPPLRGHITEMEQLCGTVLTSLAYLMFKKDLIDASDYQRLTEIQGASVYEVAARIIEVAGNHHRVDGEE